jgi:hypothetical protein
MQRLSFYPPSGHPRRRRGLVPTLNLDDSYARLGWVQKNVDAILPICAAIDSAGGQGQYVYETAAIGDFTHIMYFPMREIDVPDDLGFIISDIAVNLRSCLDMAIQAIIDGYELGLRNQQFPIETNFAKKSDGRTRALLAALPEKVAEFVIEMQPTYEGPFGHQDIPTNVTALMIRSVANANKHRNITPVAMTSSSRGFAHPATGSFELAPHRSIAGRIPLVEVRTPTDQFREEDAAQLQIMSHRELKIQRSDFRYEALPFEIDIPVATFLKDGPGYVRHVLTVFAQIHKGLESGATEFWRNQSIAF